MRESNRGRGGKEEREVMEEGSDGGERSAHLGPSSPVSIHGCLLLFSGVHGHLSSFRERSLSSVWGHSRLLMESHCLWLRVLVVYRQGEGSGRVPCMVIGCQCGMPSVPCQQFRGGAASVDGEPSSMGAGSGG